MQAQRETRNAQTQKKRAPPVACPMPVTAKQLLIAASLGQAAASPVLNAANQIQPAVLPTLIAAPRMQNAVKQLRRAIRKQPPVAAALHARGQLMAKGKC